MEDLHVNIEARAQVAQLPDHRWHIAWTIMNESAGVLELCEVRIPHDQFRAEDAVLAPPLVIPPASEASVVSVVEYAEPPGSTLTYPFIIILATWNGLACRLFGRLRVEADEQGRPHPSCEEVTVQPLPSSR